MSFKIYIPITSETCSRYINLEDQKQGAYKVYLSYACNGQQTIYGDSSAEVLMSNFLQVSNNFQAVNSNIVKGGDILGMTTRDTFATNQIRMCRYLEDDDKYITIRALPASGFYTFFKSSILTNIDRVYNNSNFADGVISALFVPLDDEFNI